MKVLTLEERVQVIKLLESGRSSRVVADQFGVGKTQIQQTLMQQYKPSDESIGRAETDFFYPV